MRGATAFDETTGEQKRISTHAPLAGRDCISDASRGNVERFQPTRPLRGATTVGIQKVLTVRFQPTRPLRGATKRSIRRSKVYQISTHAPLAGRDISPTKIASTPKIFQPTRPLRGATNELTHPSNHRGISTHAPLAGRDRHARAANRSPIDFNPRAPCGARQSGKIIVFTLSNFNPRAPCGARRGYRDICGHRGHISTHAPLAGRDDTRDSENHEDKKFQPTRPLRGATNRVFNPCNSSNISTHAPLAGRDSKSVQITMHIFAITDKFQMLLHRMPPVRAFCSFLMQENHADFGCEPPK